MDKKPDFKVIWQEILAQAYQDYTAALAASRMA